MDEPIWPPLSQEVVHLSPQKILGQWSPHFNLSQTVLDHDKKVPNGAGKTFRTENPHYLLQPVLAVALTQEFPAGPGAIDLTQVTSHPPEN